jgi:hypothetical protein
MSIVRQLGLALLVVATAAIPASAQGGRGQLRGQAPRGGQPRREMLLQNINQMFVNRATREMALTDDQLPRFRRVVTAWAGKRAALEAEERELRLSLSGQMRPGVAANADTVARIVDAINDNRVAYSETFRDEMRELRPILTPIQRGQFQIIRDQILQKIRELTQQRSAGAAMPPDTPEP